MWYFEIVITHCLFGGQTGAVSIIFERNPKSLVAFDIRLKLVRFKSLESPDNMELSD